MVQPTTLGPGGKIYKASVLTEGFFKSLFHIRQQSTFPTCAIKWAAGASRGVCVAVVVKLPFRSSLTRKSFAHVQHVCVCVSTIL